MEILRAMTDLLGDVPHVMFCAKDESGAYLTVNQAFAEFMKNNAQNASDVKDIVTPAGFPIISGWPQGFNWKQLFGVLVSGALLSLGVPFWFNSLKVLTNLRPIVANKQKEEEKKSA